MSSMFIISFEYKLQLSKTDTVGGRWLHFLFLNYVALFLSTLSAPAGVVNSTS